MRQEDVAVALAGRLVERVGLPKPFSVRAFLNQIADSRQKPIVLHPVPAGWCRSARWCSAWLDTATADHIFFVQDLSTVTTAQTVLHEVGHVRFDHSGQALPLDISLGDVDPSAIRRTRGRAGFEEVEELQAEAFSTLVLQSTMVGARTDLSVRADPKTALLEARLG